MLQDFYVRTKQLFGFKQICEKIWKEVLNKDIIPENHASELYFEEPDIEAFARKLEKLYPNIRYVNRLMTHSWGQKVVRFYDPDGNLIEVGTPM